VGARDGLRPKNASADKPAAAANGGARNRRVMNLVEETRFFRGKNAAEQSRRHKTANARHRAVEARGRSCVGRKSTDAKTAVVRGATAIDMPMAITNNCRQNNGCMSPLLSIRSSKANPAATTRGPAVKGARAPIRPDTAPISGDATAIIKGSGSNAAPAPVAEKCQSVISA
jgi:hypothetical protein